MAACKLAAKGHTMADSSYESEVQSMRTLLKLQKSGSSNGSGMYVHWIFYCNIDVDQYGY